MRQKITIVTLGVQDLQRALDFYETGLGWKRSSASTGDIVFFKLGGLVLSLYPRHLLAEDATLADTETGFSGISLAYNTQSPEEVDAVLSRVQALGATVVKPAQKVFWGGYSGYFKDLDGHLFEVAHNPFWELDEKGDVMLPD
jgi:catechol 2,3-dioxygenase-like lactoylglutathione lyase family enzyme